MQTSVQNRPEIEMLLNRNAVKNCLEESLHPTRSGEEGIAVDILLLSEQ